MKRFGCTAHGYVAAALLVGMLAGGCAATRTAEQRTTEALERNAVLEKTVTRLRAELGEQNVLIAKLQMELARKKREIARLKSNRESREAATRDIAVPAIHAPAATTKAETVAYLAEVAMEIEAAREKALPDDQELFVRADSLMARSSSELESDHFEQAALLAAQALDQIAGKRAAEAAVPKNTAVPNTAEPKSAAEPYAEFISPLSLKFAKRGNIRATPGKRGKLVATVASGTAVIALGHRDSWIKVRLADGRRGWVYSSLLSIPGELKSRK